MPVILPNNTIASRWRGALAARLRREPLERFLAAHAIVAAPPGPSCVGEQLVAGARIFLDAMLDEHGPEPAPRFTPAQHRAIADTACAVSDALARFIGNPASWRIAALVSAARALTSSMGGDAAAHHSADAVRAFATAGSRLPVDAEILRIQSSVITALAGSKAAFDEVVRLMAGRLKTPVADVDCVDPIASALPTRRRPEGAVRHGVIAAMP